MFRGRRRRQPLYSADMANSVQASPLDRFLRLFADVRAGEGLTALLLSSNVFLLLACYYILKSIRDGLILAGSGAEIKSYTSAAQVLVLAAAVPLYAKLADRVPRRRLINIVTMVFAVSFAGFAVPVLLGFAVPVLLGFNIGVVFFVWVSVFSVMIIAQFWSFANDLYNKEEGERLFPIVAFGQSLGGVVGATYTSMVVGSLGIAPLLVIAAMILAAQVVITNYVDARERRVKETHVPAEQSSAQLTATGAIPLAEVQRMLDRFSGEPSEPDAADADEPEEPPPPSSVEEKPDTSGAFALVFRSRYLLMIGVLMLLLNFVNTTGGYILDKVVEVAAADAIASGAAGGMDAGAFISAYMGRFYAVVNLVGLVIQLFVVSRVVKYLGVAVGLMILPMISLGAYSLIAFYPVISYIRWAKTAENATDYSLNNTVRNILFLPTTREQKYKAKQVIDSFFVRVGDTLSATLVLVGTTFLAFNLDVFAKVNLVAVGIWLVLAFMIGKEYRKQVAASEPPV